MGARLGPAIAAFDTGIQTAGKCSVEQLPFQCGGRQIIIDFSVIAHRSFRRLPAERGKS